MGSDVVPVTGYLVRLWGQDSLELCRALPVPLRALTELQFYTREMGRCQLTHGLFVKNTPSV